MIQLDEQVEKLARARQIEAEYKTAVAALQTKIEEEIAEKYGDRLDTLKEYLATAKEDVDVCSDIVRALSAEQFGVDGNKHPHPAVGIREMKVLGYDPDEAFRYCVRHLTAALKMDKRQFEKVAKVVGLDFVTIGTEPRATIARDLSGYLDAETEGDGHD